MKTNNSTSWLDYKIVSSLTNLLLLVALMIMLANQAKAFSLTAINGNLYTNATAPYYQSVANTNSSGVISNNFQVGVVPGSSNVFWTLSTSQSYQVNNGTNVLWLPSEPISLIGYPGTLYGPANNLTVAVTGSLMASNASSTSLVFQFAGYDGYLWITNYLTMTYIVPVNYSNAVTTVLSTNIQTGGMQYLALQQINNPGVAAFTNIVLDFATKPGL